MGSIGPEKILLLLLVVLLLFGAKRIPEIGASLGKGIREFKGSLSGANEPEGRVAPPPPAAEPVRRSEPASVARSDNEPTEPRRLIP